jgi:hypothetical protein
LSANHELILILDFGSQYTQLIARRVREQGVYCEIVPFHLALEKILEKNPKGVILSGGPNSVYEADAPQVDADFYRKSRRRFSAFATECSFSPRIWTAKSCRRTCAVTDAHS